MVRMLFGAFSSLAPTDTAPAVATPVLEPTSSSVTEPPVAGPRPAPLHSLIATTAVGNFPTAIALSPDGQTAYVVNNNDDTLSVLDTARHLVIGTIPVGARPFSIALSPDGERAFITNASDNTVVHLRLPSGMVIARNRVGANPYGVAVSPDGCRLFVTNQDADSVSVIETRRCVITAEVQVGRRPAGVAVSPSGDHVYVVNNGDHSMSVVDTLTNTAVTTVAVGVGVGPSAVALSPDGATAFVTNTFDGSVCLIDLASATVTKTVLVGEHPLNVAVSHDGRLAYVSELDESCHHGSVSIIDMRTGVVMAVPGGSPCGLACDPHVYRVFATDFAAGTVSLIASVGDDYWPQLGQVVGWHPAREVTDLRIDRAAGEVCTDATTGATFVTDREHDSVSIMASPPRNVAVGASPTAVAIRPDSTRAYVTNPGDGTVSVIDTVPGSVTHLEVIDTVEVGHLAARGILISSDGRRGYAADDVTGGIWVIDTDLDSPLCHQVVSRILLQHRIFDLALGSSHLFAVPYCDHLIAVDVTTEAVTEIALPGRPYRVTVCPDASRVYAHLFDDDAICAIDVGSYATTATLNLGEHGQEIAFSSDGKLAYVAGPAAHSVYVISTKTSRITAVDVGRGPRDVAVSSDGARAYVANLLDDSVSVIESRRRKVVSTIDVGSRPCRVALSPDCCHAYVANHCDNTLSVLDTDSPAVSTTIAVGRQPFDITVSPDGKRIYVDHADGISVVSL